MSELASAAAGAVILCASSYDANHPAKSVLEPHGYWITTGSFPQELVLQLGAPSSIKSALLVASGVRRVEVAKCEGSQANTWETIVTTQCDESDDVQRINLQIPPRVNATYLRFKIVSAWSPFAVVYKLSVIGSDKDKSERK